MEGVRTPATPEDRLNLTPPAPVKPQILAPAPTIVEVPAAEVPAEVPAVEAPAAEVPPADATTQARKKNRSRR